MKEAFECLNRATVCDTMAGNARDAASTRALRGIADQWRQLARDTDRHKRQTGKQAVAEPHETAPDRA